MTDAAERLTSALADRYRIERELGHGGMATVYLAEDLKHHRKVAVKVLRPELAAALGSERFLREIETTANLRHPHILPLFDSGLAIDTESPAESSSRTPSGPGHGDAFPAGPRSPSRRAAEFLFYVMPLVEGETLRDRLSREKQLPVEEALRIAREVADALSYAHGRGVIHRDIKPENILLESGHALVADFGIARAVSSAEADRLTETGLAVGTPTYMSPEQAAGGRDLDGRSDLYALGCVLYEMLAGQPPFTGPTAQSIAHQHLTATPPPITQLRPAVPGSVAAALDRSLAKNPADRFTRVSAFADALRVLPAPERVDTPRVRVPASLGWLAVILLGGVTVLLIRRPPATAPLRVIARTLQVTRDAGLELDPAISPDGNFVAYATGPTTHLQLFVRQVAGGRTVPLTVDTSGNNRWPRWSPDGTRLAYQASDGIYLIPALGGAPRLLVRPPAGTFTLGGDNTPLLGLSWSPDGHHIAFAGNTIGSRLLYIVDAETGTVSTLSAPPETHSPAWSPDGRHLAVVSNNSKFVFGSVHFANQGASSLWAIPVDGSGMVRVTEASSLNCSPQWTADSRAILFVSDRGGTRDIYRILVDDHGTPVAAAERMTTGLGAHSISLSADGLHLAYARLQSTANIWSIPVPRRGTVSATVAVPVTTGNQVIESIDISADGKWLAFDSDRGGAPNIFKMSVPGGEPIQLTTDSVGAFSPAWSPDGRLVAYHRARNGMRDVFTMNADGTHQTQRTHGIEEALAPAWSPSGDTLVFSTRTAGGDSLGIVTLDDSLTVHRLPLDVVGDLVIWAPIPGAITFHAPEGIRTIATAGGPSHLLTSNRADSAEAFASAWSPDGSRLFYQALSQKGWVIRMVARQGGPSRLLVRFTDPARQPTPYGFRTDGEQFYLTMGTHESDIWVMELGR